MSIETAIAAAKGKASLLEVEKALLALKELEHPTRLLHRLNGYELKLGATIHLGAEEKVLRALAPLKLALVPEVVEHWPITESESVLLLRYRACERGKLVPAERGLDSQPPVTADRALAEYARLLESGAMHLFAGRGLASWLLVSDSGALVLSDWGVAIAAVRSEDRANALARVEETLRPG